MSRLFLDANVFLYALGGESPYREDCRAVLSAVAEGRVVGVTNTEVLQEVLHVRKRRLGANDATAAVRAAAALVAEVLPVGAEEMLTACDLLDRHGHLSARDALHVAVMRNAGISRLVSVDSDFDVVKEVERLKPKDALRVRHGT